MRIIKSISALSLAVLLALSLTLSATAQDAKPAAGDLVPLELKLPKPLFIGTPKNIESPNLEKPTGKPRPAFMVPKGTTNLSLTKPVTSSDKEPITGEAALLTDGDNTGTDGTFVEFGPGLQWAQVDLGASSELYAILVWHYHTEARVYHDVIVQVSDDPDFITNVKTVYNNDHDNSAGMGVGKDKEYIETFEGRLIDAKGVKGRYVRFYSKGNTSSEENHYVEVQVYGKAAK